MQNDENRAPSAENDQPFTGFETPIRRRPERESAGHDQTRDVIFSADYDFEETPPASMAIIIPGGGTKK